MNAISAEKLSSTCCVDRIDVIEMTVWISVCPPGMLFMLSKSCRKTPEEWQLSVNAPSIALSPLLEGSPRPTGDTALYESQTVLKWKSRGNC